MQLRSRRTDGAGGSPDVAEELARAWKAMEALPATGRARKARRCAAELLRWKESRSSADEVVNVETTAKHLCTHLGEVLGDANSTTTDVHAVIEFVEAMVRLFLADTRSSGEQGPPTEPPNDASAWSKAMQHIICCVPNALTDSQASSEPKTFKMVEERLAPLWVELARTQPPQPGTRLDSGITIKAVDALLQTTMILPDRKKMLKHISLEQLGEVFCNATDYSIASDAMEIALKTRPVDLSPTIQNQHWEQFFKPWRAAVEAPVAECNAQGTRERLRQGLEAIIAKLVELKEDGRFDSIATDAIETWAVSSLDRPQGILCKALSGAHKIAWLFARPLSLDTKSQLAASKRPREQQEFIVWIGSRSLYFDVIDPDFVVGRQKHPSIAEVHIPFDNLHSVEVGDTSGLITIKLKTSLWVRSYTDGGYEIGSALMLYAHDTDEEQKLYAALRRRFQSLGLSFQENGSQLIATSNEEVSTTVREQPSSMAIPKHLASHLSKCPPALAAPRGAMAKSALVCRLPDNPRFPEISPSASQADVRRERVDELQKATGEDGHATEPSSSTVGAFKHGPPSDPTRAQDPEPATSSKPRAKASLASTALKAIRGTLDMSDSVDVMCPALTSERDIGAGAARPARVSTSTKSKNKTAPEVADGHVSDLSDPSGDDTDLPTPRRDVNQSAAQNEAGGSLMRKLSLMIPPMSTSKKAGAKYYTAKRKLKERSPGPRSDKGEAENKATSTRKVTEKIRTESTDEFSTAMENIDYDAILGEEPAPVSPSEEPKNKRRSKKNSKGNDTSATTKPSRAKKNATKTPAKATKRKFDVEDAPRKKQKLNKSDNPASDRLSRPTRKAGAAAAKKSRAMLKESPEPEGDDDGQSNTDNEPVAETKTSSVAAVSSPLFRKTESTSQAFQKRPIHPWNRPSQLSEHHGTKIINEAGKQKPEQQTGAQHEEQASPMDRSPPRRDELISVGENIKEGISFQSLPVAASPFCSPGLDDAMDAFTTTLAFDRTVEIEENAAISESAAAMLESAVLLVPLKDDTEQALEKTKPDHEVVTPTEVLDRAETSLWKSYTTICTPEDEHPSTEVGDAQDAELVKGEQNIDDAKSTVAKAKEGQQPLGTAIGTDQEEERSVSAQVMVNQAFGVHTEKRSASSRQVHSGDMDTDADPGSAQKQLASAADQKKAMDTRPEGQPARPTQSTVAPARAAHGIDFSAIDSCADSSTLLKIKSASMPVPKLHVERRTFIDRVPLKGGKGDIPQRLQNVKTQVRKEAVQPNLLKEREKKKVQAPSKYTSGPTTSTPMKKTAKVATVSKHAHDPGLKTVLSAARLNRRSAQELRQSRHRTAGESEERERAHQATIEELAMELAKVITELEMKQTRTLKKEYRHDLRKLMQDVYAELGSSEEENAEVVQALMELRDYLGASRSALLKRHARMREELACGRVALDALSVKVAPVS